MLVYLHYPVLNCKSVHLKVHPAEIFPNRQRQFLYNLLENTINLVRTEKETYKDYYIKNYEKWSSRVSGGNSECVWQLNTYKDINTAQGLAADYLIDWLTKRFAYLDSQWCPINVEENIPENAEVYKLEAEYATLGNFTASNPIRTDKSYASNNSYVGNVNQGTTITFTVTAEEATTAYLFAGVSKRTTERHFTDMFSVTVNGETILIPLRSVPAISGSEEDWHSILFGDGYGYLSPTWVTWHYDYAPPVPGDANGDGKVNNHDLALLQQYLNEWDVSIEDADLDVNNDGKINNRDLALLQQYLSEWDVELK